PLPPRRLPARRPAPRKLENALGPARQCDDGQAAGLGDQFGAGPNFAARLMLDASPCRHSLKLPPSFLPALRSVGSCSFRSCWRARVAFKDFDTGRPAGLVKQVMNAGHGILGLIAICSALAALMAGAVAGAAVAAVGGVFAFMCKFALAPRDDKPIKGHRVL